MKNNKKFPSRKKPTTASDGVNYHHIDYISFGASVECTRLKVYPTGTEPRCVVILNNNNNGIVIQAYLSIINQSTTRVAREADKWGEQAEWAHLLNSPHLYSPTKLQIFFCFCFGFCCLQLGLHNISRYPSGAHRGIPYVAPKGGWGKGGRWRFWLLAIWCLSGCCFICQ